MTKKFDENARNHLKQEMMLRNPFDYNPKYNNIIYGIDIANGIETTVKAKQDKNGNIEILSITENTK